MRITVAIDDDVFELARAHAQRERITLGKAISQLAGEGIRARSLSAAVLPKPQSRFALFPSRHEIITSEHVRDLIERKGI